MGIQEILVVDDDSDILSLVKQILEIEGMTVVVAANAEVALRHLCEKVFSLMITDRSMPGLDGFALARKAAVIAPLMPIVMMTGDILPDTPHMAKKAGIAVVLNKPFHPTKLLQAIQELYLHQSPVPEPQAR